MARRGTPSFTERHDLGRMDQTCVKCGAKMWKAERTARSAVEPLFSMCCGEGKYVIEPYCDAPELITNLLRGTDNESKEFRENIRAYNNALGFTSLGCKLDNSVANSHGGAYCFRIHGNLYHRIGGLNVEEGEIPKFAQIYIHDSSNELSNRLSHNPQLNPETLQKLQALMHEVNPFVHDFKAMADIRDEQGGSIPDVAIVFNAEGSPDPRRYNSVTSANTEIGVLIVDGSGQQGSQRDIVLRPTMGGLVKINERNQNYDPFTYVLMFPTGQRGWCPSTTSIDESKKITTMRFYAFHLMIRENNNCLHLFSNLFQQYVVDMFAKMEQCRLNFIRFNQDKLRMDVFSGLQDAVRLDDGVGTLENHGRKIILPSSFIGSSRFMAQLYQDAISIVRRFGKPDFFITFTCNPTWPEIQNELLHGQKPSDRPDLSARVFNKKLNELMDDLTKKRILGKVVAHIHVIEFQKRGLPHAHILLIVAEADKPRTVQDIDLIVSARIPDQSEQPLAYEMVTRNMMHGPCGQRNPNSPCMKDGKCSKGFPKKLCTETTAADNGFPLYKRPYDGRGVVRGGATLDNTWVVPYNVDLCIKYNAHINVEICNTAKSVKYIYKYVYKGHDRASVLMKNNQTSANVNLNSTSSTTNNTEPQVVDEIQEHLDARYVSAAESTWRILHFSLHHEYPSHQRLQIHLPGMQFVTYEGEQTAEQVVNRASRRDTTLLAWFKYNLNHTEARQYLYVEFPEHFTWSQNAWHPRDPRSIGTTIGRIYNVSPSDIQKYYLRMLLYHKRGATSFEDLRTVNGEVCPTFQDACRRLNLLEDDNEWDNCTVEGRSYQSPVQIRRLFATILLFCFPSDPFSLWNTHKEYLAEDHVYKHTMSLEVPELSEANLQIAYEHCLLDINDLLLDGGKSLTDYEGFVLPENDTRNENFSSFPAVLREQLLLNAAAALLPNPADLPFNDNQRTVFNCILNLVRTVTNSNITPKVVFIDGPGGTGKTFLFNAILDAVRRENQIAIAVAHSGTAATLLKGGRTAHSTFRIPLEVSSESTCNITANSDVAVLLRQAKIVLWDEASMISKDQIGTVDRTLRDIMKKDNPLLENVPFGGKLFVFGGDFRQVLPVVPNATRAGTVDQCLNRSSLWRHVQVYRLATNMRVQQALSSNNLEVASALQAFADYLLTIGNGSFPSVPNTDLIRIPDEMLFSGPDDFSTLANHIYNNFRTQSDISVQSMTSVVFEAQFIT